ncbi:M24 family metallopeptidase [Lacticaseibacillus porcinae]|uniref:M24 family metallopeptidase n=1 Tax=Lacticaseibacillus porcinae TaxID=1123687 RepID=UPI000F77E14F|nr:Xaa-Pro peptidase family protein [Lacticaseibacillus porcinae]
MSRISRLRELLKAKHLDGLLVTDPVNVSYLTGFTGDESALLVTADDSLFITDSRFTTQFHQQVHNSRLVLHQDHLLSAASEHAQGVIGFEAEYMTYADFLKLQGPAQWQATTDLVSGLREVKDDAELADIKQAIAIAEAGYQHVLQTIKPGMTELQVANDLDQFMKSLGASGTSFETIVASGLRSAMPHGMASDKVIVDGDIVTLDWGAVYHGYVSDITRTFVMGHATAELEQIYHVVYEANLATTKQMRAGVLGKTINDFAHHFIDDAGYGEYFGHGTGHGIGMSIHEGPGAWGPYREVPQAPGNVETVEPGIYVPGVGGVRIEDDILITADDPIVLTSQAPPTLEVVPV